MWGHIWISNECVSDSIRSDNSNNISNHIEKPHKTHTKIMMSIPFELAGVVLMAKRISKPFALWYDSVTRANTEINAQIRNAVQRNKMQSAKIWEWPSAAAAAATVRRRWWWFAALHFNYMHFEFFVHLITLNEQNGSRSFLSKTKTERIGHRRIVSIQWCSLTRTKRNGE